MDRRSALRKTSLFAGATVIMPSILSMLQSCKEVNRIDYTPEFFTVAEASFLAAFADTILPKTTTPGALDVNADVFIDKVVANIYDKKGKEDFKANISEFNAEAKSAYGKTFSELSQEDKNAFLSIKEKEGGKFNSGVWGTAVGEQEPVSFYRSLKSTVLWAYFSSEEIGKNVLSYDPIPGAYLGCIPLEDVGNKWSL
jgi:hypothetical protein